MRQAIALFECSQKRKMEDIRVQAKLLGVELKDEKKEESFDLTPEQEELLFKARNRALKRIREEKIG